MCKDNCQNCNGVGYLRNDEGEEESCVECEGKGVVIVTTQKFEVQVCRTGYGFATIVVEAETQAEANELALDEAGDHEYNEKDSEYALCNAPAEPSNLLISWTWDSHSMPVQTGSLELTPAQYERWQELSTNQKCELVGESYRSDGYFNWNYAQTMSVSDADFANAEKLERLVDDDD